MIAFQTAKRRTRTCGATFALCAGLAWIPSGQGAVVASLHEGTTCSGSTTVQYAAGGAAKKVAVCVSTNTEKLCGVSYRLKASSAAFDNHFQLTARQASSSYNELTPASLPQNIVNAPAGDLGAAPNPQIPVAAGASQLIAVLDIQPTINATNSPYTIALDAPFSVALVDQDDACGAANAEPVEAALAATITFTQGTPPQITSANAGTFTVGFNGTLQVTADGTPAPALTIGGQALPGNVTFTPASGVLAGIPQLGTVGTYNLTFTASNGNLPNATQNFTLTVQKANQAITFGPLGNKTFGDPSFMVSATTNATGLSVSFGSGTPATCGVSGNTVTILAAGTCTVNAIQAGNANYNPAATVPQSFAIAATTPGAPTIGTATAGDGSAQVTFTAPMNTGGAPIQSYTATCGMQSATGMASPITVMGLTNGTPVTCTVTAFNGTATSAASAASNSVTPLAQFTVTPSAGANGSISPAMPVLVTQGGTTMFSVTPNTGFVASVGGTCGGSLAGNTFTTAAITANCTVDVTFVALITYNLVLEGAQEVPPNASTGTGSGTAIVDTVNNTIALNVTFSGIGSLTDAHLHGNGARGVGAGVKVPVTDFTSQITQTLTYLQADEAAILAGNWYLNLHTAAFPGGELRAQLDNLGAANKTLTTSVVGTGTITGTGINCPGDCSESYAQNTMVALTATPGTGYSFTGWSGACSGTGACNVTMDFVKSVTATFTINSYLLTTVVNGTGSGTIAGTGIACPGDCTESFTHGTMVTLTAMPNTGSTFTGWSGACSGTGMCTVTMDAAKSVTATFAINSYALTVTRNGTGAGTVTSTPAGINCGATCSANYNHGTMVTLTASADVSSTFTGWSGGGCSGTGTCAVSMTAANTVTATFAINAYTVTPSAGMNGSISPSMPVATNHGTMLAFTVTPDAGYTAAVTGTCGGSLTGNTYTTNAITMDCTVVASFNPNIALVRVESRKLHGAFTCNLPITTGIPIGGNVSIEPRDNGQGHQIVFVFDAPVTLPGSASVTPAGSASGTANGNEVRVALNGIADGSRATVALTGVNGAVNTSASLGFLLGDVTGSRAISAADIATAKARLNTSPLTSATCAADINVDGQIKSSDVTAVKNRSGNQLP